VLHQATREKDGTGKVVARLDDYAAVRALVAEMMAEGVGIAALPDVRETVEAVKEPTDEKRKETNNPSLPCGFTY
jgi:hypothetical protein